MVIESMNIIRIVMKMVFSFGLNYNIKIKFIEWILWFFFFFLEFVEMEYCEIGYKSYYMKIF